MESAVTPLGAAVPKQTLTRRSSSSIPLQDLWAATREGSIADLESALLVLKKNGGNIDARNTLGSTALHIAVWRNHVPMVRRLLAAGADPNARDGESGWSSLHRALHFGHLAVAGVIIEAGASLTLEDSRARTPVDLLSGPVQQVITDENNAGATELFSWGNGSNYQLGTGNARIQKLPCKLEALQGLFVTAIAAAKFHSVAVTVTGELYTWGFGRGGRLGHPDFDIHSGQAAVITPRLVTGGLGLRRVKVIAAAKHHTIVATEGGEVFTWGSNREGQLGYTSVDTQSTPRRVSSLKTRVIAVAAANKHSTVVTEPGEVYTWGCNRDGQLGYGTSNSASNYIPRAVESLKGKRFVAVSAAKYHTVVLGADGEVFTWGYKMVSPRRVTVARNTKKSGIVPLKFHRMERLHVVAIAAGMTHSTALSDDGTLFYWVSSDPNLRCQQLYSMSSSDMVSVSAGKYWTAFVTATGDVYTWDGKKFKDDAPIPCRVHGIKHATAVSVGENHFLVVSALYIPKYPPKQIEVQTGRKDHCEEADELENDDMTLNDYRINPKINECGIGNLDKHTPSLKDLCQKVAAEFLVEPKNAVQLLDIADALGADDLRIHCEDLVLHNLDYILTVSASALANVSTELLAKLEKSLDAKSSEPWSYRHLPTPTATFPAIIDSEEDDSEIGFPRLRNISSVDASDQTTGERRSNDGFLHQTSAADRAMAKQVRAIRKKLQQIEILEMKQANGHSLDDQQRAKLQTKHSLENALTYLESGVATELREELSLAFSKPNVLDGNSISKGDLSRKRRCKDKKKSNRLASVQIGDLPETSDIETTLKTGLRKRPDESCSLKNFEDPDHSSYNAEGAGTKSGHQSVLSSFKKATLATSDDHGSDVILPCNQNVDMKNSSDHDLEVKTSLKGTQFTQKLAKKKSKKGGLSVFLSGALDDAPKVAAPAPVTPKVEGPAWGGARITKGPTSLLEIQSEQIVESNIPKTPESSRVTSKSISSGRHSLCESMRGSKALVDAYELDRDEGESSQIHIPLSQLVRTSAPIAVIPKKGTCASDAEKCTPPWAGTSPLTSRSSLREIQMQQVKQQQSISQSPKTKSPVGSLAVAGSAVFSDHGPHVAKDIPSRWFKPEANIPSSIRCIQIEEKAMKDLSRFYKNVKLVKNDMQ